VITYGRTLEEAHEMARNAIRCQLEALRKDGLAHPNERTARKEKLRVAVAAWMSRLLPVFEAREVVCALLSSEFEFHHQKTGSHSQLPHPSKPHLNVDIPRFGRFDLFQPILMSTLRGDDAGGLSAVSLK
jgi:predicted RNA binding protein YcfA (HicA-like mRNA interferase family)